jgi:hypothetical protein
MLARTSAIPGKEGSFIRLRGRFPDAVASRPAAASAAVMYTFFTSVHPTFDLLHGLS